MDIRYHSNPMSVRKQSYSEMARIIDKNRGIITERDTGLCTIRIRLPGGQITGDQMVGLAKILKKHGMGSIHLTTRQTLEISHISSTKVQSFLTALEKVGISPGAEHDAVVNITACPGSERCRFANITTTNILANLDEMHFGLEMPIRVRIAISACPNGCTSERLSEIGITGIREPVRNDAKCTGCGMCAHTCKEHAIVMINGKLFLDSGKCIACGMCIDSCPFHLIEGSLPQYIITIGGKRGRHPLVGRELIRIHSGDDAVAVVNRIVDWIYRTAYSGKSLAEQLDTMDFSGFQERLQKEYK